jgi:lipopolysaccharide/colanic/teichoic acid biosynthesis glycosyltransferase
VVDAPGLHGAADLEFVSVGGAIERLAPARGTRAAVVHHVRTAVRGRSADVLEANVWADSPARAGWRAALKRVLDVVGAVAGLVIAIPVMLLLAPLIALASPGPVLFAHTRLGRDGRPFRCYKLRTMCADAEAHLAADPLLRAAYLANGFKLPSDADRRVTPLGRFMRLTSLDELPQFWNVLKGDMALVGPRPIVDEELQHYPVRDRRILLSLRPGITGAWAVGGRNRLGYPARARVELDYVRRWTFGRDLAILGRTLGAVIGRQGAI